MTDRPRQPASPAASPGPAAGPVMPFSAADILLTPAEAAAIYQAHPATIRRWALTGRIDSVRTPGGTRRYSGAQARAWLAGPG